MTICRLENRWCDECCSGTRKTCPFRGRLPDGSRGCLRHDEIKADEMCGLVDCLVPYSDEQKRLVEQAIKNLPKGEFRMQYVL